jgi:two-component system sensor histidine kinase CpxA
MRSIVAKVVLWALGTFAFSLTAFAALALIVSARSHGPTAFVSATMALLRDDACRAYDEGGPEGLGRYLHRLDAYYPGVHLLTDAGGRDLVSGEDRSALLKRGGPASDADGPWWRPPLGPRVFVHDSPDGRYRFLARVEPRFDPWGILPYYAAILVVIGLLGYALAAHLVAPLRELRRTVDRFGHGDLSARVHSVRKDEIGDLARSFDRMAERIETLLSVERRLLQDVSHELRSPLARVAFAVELARSGEDRNAALARITREVGRLTVLVEELLKLAQAEGDPSSREPEDLALRDLIAMIAEDHVLEAGAKGCRITVRADGPGLVRGERELIRRAVENVLRNAVRHAPDETPIAIDLNQDGDTVTIQVRDHGPGVPEECLEAIFEAFFRVGSDRSRASGGIGIGLSIARRAVELHGGRIDAKNAHPGLRVTIELPAAGDIPG